MGHLLLEEFSIVLNEFSIHIDDKNFKKFLQRFKIINFIISLKLFINLEFFNRHGLVKHNQLIEYEKFLQIFQDQSPNSLSKNFKDSNG